MKRLSLGEILLALVFVPAVRIHLRNSTRPAPTPSYAGRHREH